RTDGATRVTGCERELARSGEALGIRSARGPALEENGGRGRAPHRRAHSPPGDRRPRMEKLATGERERVTSGGGARPSPARTAKPIERFTVGGGDIHVHGRTL